MATFPLELSRPARFAFSFSICANGRGFYSILREFNLMGLDLDPVGLSLLHGCTTRW
jgi:hypothetical protein